MTLQDLRYNGKNGNWPVVAAIILVSALKYGNHFCPLPCIWQSVSRYTGIANAGDVRGNDVRTNLDYPDTYAIQSSVFRVGHSIQLFEYKCMCGCWDIEINIVRFML